MLRLFSFSLLLSLLSLVQLSEAAPVSSDRIFPDSTKGYFAIRNLKEFGEQWRQTQTGQLMNDPLMEGFKEDIQKQIANRLSKTFGLTLDGISALPSGEVAIGMIAIPDQVPGYVFTMDIHDRRPIADEYVKKLSDKLVLAGVKRSAEKYKEQEIIIFKFPEIPRPERARTADGEEKPEAKPVERFAYYMFKDDHLIVSDQLHLIKLIADRTVKQTGKCLADVEDYQIVMKRCLDDMPKDSQPIVRWYVEPLNYGESLRVLLQEPPSAVKKKEKPSIFSVLKQQGFDAIRGVGGVVSLKAEGKESIYRIFVYAKKPYRLAMRMLVFPDNTNFVPPTWMPADIARCTVIYLDPMAIFDNFGTLFDALVMQGEEGVWEGIVKDLEEDPYGPKINLREELVVNLGHRVLGMTKYEVPITPNSESIVFALEIKEGKEEAMFASVKKLFDGDPEMQGDEHRSYIIWHRIPAEDIIAPVVIDVPSLVDAAPTSDKKPAVKVETEEDAPPIFPDGAIAVAKGCLFVSTNIEYLKTILDRLDAEQEAAIKNEKEYKEIDQIFASMGITEKPHFLQFFARTHATLRPTYELIRQGRMPHSNTVLGKAMNALLAPDAEPGTRKQAFDGSLLPPFNAVEKYFGSVGLYGISEENGYFFTGFLLNRESENDIGPNRKAEK
jgi:hypothetical protein